MEQFVTDSFQSTGGRYEVAGWTQWPDNLEKSFKFARILGSAQEGAATISECFLTASRIDPCDNDSWHDAWSQVAAVNNELAQAAEQAGFYETARSNWLRSANYYRAAEFFLDHADARRLMTFDRIEQASHRYLDLLRPKGEIVRVPYEAGYLDAYILRAPSAAPETPVIICFGRLDEFKDELLHEMPRHAFARGLSLLLVDLPGQGGSLRRRGLTIILEMERPVGACVDYLLSRGDVDVSRIALYGASLGGFYAPRAAAFEHRIACVVSDGVIWNSLSDREARMERFRRDPDSLIVRQMVWATGQETYFDAIEFLQPFTLTGVLESIRCPFLLVHGEADFAGLQQAYDCFEYAKARGMDVSLKIFSAAETGAAHCQADNPTLGQEVICDWIASRMNMEQSYG